MEQYGLLLPPSALFGRCDGLLDWHTSNKSKAPYRESKVDVRERMKEESIVEKIAAVKEATSAATAAEKVAHRQPYSEEFRREATVAIKKALGTARYGSRQAVVMRVAEEHGVHWKTLYEWAFHR